jgi:excisionase family DNA binding protein
MSPTMYSPDEVADLLGLHVRTIRHYVRDGRLPAVRIGKQYRISEADLRAFTGGAPAAAPPRLDTTTVVRIADITRELMDRVSTLALAGASAARLQVHTSYEPAQRTLTVVAVGDADDAAALLSMVSALIRDAAS